MFPERAEGVCFMYNVANVYVYCIMIAYAINDEDPEEKNVKDGFNG